MSGRLTQTGVDAMAVVEVHPDLDPTPILKLALFAYKIKANQRQLKRLVFEAEWTEHPRAEIAKAASISKRRVGEIIDAGVGDLSWPRTYREPEEWTVLDELNQVVSKTKRHRERLDWWIMRASDRGWSGEQIARIAGLREIGCLQSE